MDRNCFHYSHNPYFNRWFSAILEEFKEYYIPLSHNPYFNRWFSAINLLLNFYPIVEVSQSLF